MEFFPGMIGLLKISVKHKIKHKYQMHRAIRKDSFGFKSHKKQLFT